MVDRGAALPMGGFSSRTGARMFAFRMVMMQPTSRLAPLRRDRLLLALVCGTAAVVCFEAAGTAGAAVQVIAAWVVIAAVHACLIAVAAATARTPGLTAGARRFWASVAVGAAIYLAGDIAQVAHAAAAPRTLTAATGGTAQVAALTVGSAVLMIALLAMPLGFGTSRERVRFWMDVATVMVAALVVGWYLVVPSGGGDAGVRTAGAVVRGPVVVLLCCFVVAKLIMSGTAPFTGRCAALGVTAAVVKSGADALARDGLTERTLPWFLALTVAAHALLCIAIRATQQQIRDDPQAVTRRRGRRRYSLLPYAAIAVTFALLIVAVRMDQRDAVPIALAGAATSTVLVVLRQLDAFRENERLLRELDAKVTELHSAQQGLHRSLAERDSLAARLHHQAFHDDLTGLPNRSLYAERLDAVLTRGAPAVVMLVDLDDFKLVNDDFGHAAGDALLREIGRRLRGCVHVGDTVARLGGDEFAVLISPPHDDPAEVAARIVAAVGAPMAVDGGAARVGASVGIAMTTPSGPARTAEALLRTADRAMYAVKRAGKGSFTIADGAGPQSRSIR
ncbi:GGDEF domain-containing protein [Mangrovihabitans endophyticus]|uniref:GGDEF domain-containing protein n=1 Tax=Mangrovihabitans endophyticus TaxID=1751298 RepID=A0A8J3FN57_9ACTN|nr:GGDEF domain-containing protein [Mangrovihabitans endophyticus]GGK84539.1 hypothetical protein GCM10012284_18500 [Mangrovihabitans endophyticus]